MTTRAASAARSAPPSHSAAAPARPSLHAVTARRSNQRDAAPSASKARRRPQPVAIAVGLVVASLLAVVVGNMELSAGQLGLEQAQARLVATESSYAQQLELVARAESPANVAILARNNKLVLPSETLTIHSVPLMRRLGPPVFSSTPCCSITPGR